MNENTKTILQKTANAIRVLSMDAIDKANSGHPGLPLGCAEIGACLYGHSLRHNPANPDWMGRDRFILSAGHGSMLLYSCLHLSGYDLSLEELKNFRQLGSKTPGHPEYKETAGVETTTGPLGQGFANAAGLALANKMMAAQLGMEKEGLLGGQIFALAGDGCLMEGITNETASLAAHLKLDNLTVIYDSNDICLDGPTKECFTEDTKGRFKALGWEVCEIDGHDLDAIEKAIEDSRARNGKPTLIEARTVIGKGAPNKQGTHKVHGAPLGEEESKAAKEALGLSPEPFFVPEDVTEFLNARKAELQKAEDEWKAAFDKWAEANADKAKLYDAFLNKTLPADLDAQLRGLEIGDAPGRSASNKVLQKIAEIVPFVVGGSADLSCSDNTMMKDAGVVSSGDYSGRNIKYGVREFAMGAMNNGLALQGMTVPYCGTFLVFSDYLRNAIRLAALMQLKLAYQFTHDSIFVGEDGPTHQPVEHAAALRAIPGLTVMRPADSNEVAAAWSWFLRESTGPCAFILTRQGLPLLEGSKLSTEEGVARGGYVIQEASNPSAIDLCLLATGSEVHLAVDAANQLEEKGKSVRVVSMPSFELFDAQDKAYQDKVLGTNVKKYWAIEMQVEQGWHKYVGRDGGVICMSRFGASGPGKECAKKFGFTVDQVVATISQAD